MGFLNMHALVAYLSAVSSYLPAVLITFGVAMMIACAVSCNCSPGEDKDDLFHREVY